MDAIFEALASSPRRRILLYLAEDDMTAGQIAARFDMSKPAISKHLQLLESAGLVGSRKRGQFVHYWLVRDALADTLGDFLRKIAPPTPKPVDDLFAEQLERAREAYAADLAGRFGEVAT